jgi:two-component system response regulator YesN
MVRLLIADDEEIIRSGLLSIGWEGLGVQVVADVDNGYEALEILQSEIIDVLLTDIRMPGLDGLELARFISERELCTKVIFLSGYSDFEYARQGIQYNVMRYVLKPSRPDEIIDAVKEASAQVDRQREADMRLRLLEAELGKRQLVVDQGGFVLGEIRHSSIVGCIFKYILENYANPISLSSMSDSLNFSTIYLSRVLKKATGYTFLEVVNAIRIHTAVVEVREGRRTLEDISEGVGIHGARYFCQLFKKYYGVTPSAYKKTHCLPADTKLACLVQSIQDSTRETNAR